ncbi:MAG: ABC transporter permease [Actinomycetota bacterium]|nr:ABC transporter permease [Actinomycetota bacterium]
MNGTLAVARYTLLEISRRRILLVFLVVGIIGIALLGIVLKLAPISMASIGPPGAGQPDPAAMSRFLELNFVRYLISVVGFFALLIAFAIGMTAIYHDLESGAAVAIFSKPITRLAFTIGKVVAAIVAMILVVGLLGMEARLLMALFGGGLERAMWVETVASVANAILLMLIVLALSTWMNNIVAAVVALIYNFVGGVVVGLHAFLGAIGAPAALTTVFNILYWLVPHQLTSDAARQLVKAQYEIFTPPQGAGAPTADQILRTVPGASGTQDILWWAFLVVLMATLVYVAVRRRQV